MIAHYCETQCAYCEMSINRAKQLEHSEKCKKELCEFCGKIFAKNKIKNHLEIQCNEKKVECDMCSYTCERKNIQEHRSCYHMISKK